MTQQRRGNSRYNNNGGNNNQQARKQEEERALTVVQPPRLPMPPEATAAGVSLSQWRSLTDAVFPSAKSVGGVMLALEYCKARGLDPFKRPVHVVPMWNSKLRREVETVWPGVGELRTTATRTGLWAGNDECSFGRILKQGFRVSQTKSGQNDEPYTVVAEAPEMEFPEWAQFTVYKIVAGIRVPFVGPKVYFMETFSGEKGLRVPNARWRLAPRQMLEKCAEAAALRRAFPEEMAGDMTAEEMEGKVMHSDVNPAAAKYQDTDQGQDEGQQDGGSDQQDSGGDGGDQGDGHAAGDQEPVDDFGQEERDAFLSELREGLARCPNTKVLDAAMDKRREKLALLSDEERADIYGLAQQRRDQLQGNQAPEQQQQERGRDGGAIEDAEIAEPAAAGDDGAREEPPFVRNLRMRVDEVELLIDLTRLEQTEQRSIDNLPAWAARICEQMIADKREALTPA